MPLIPTHMNSNLMAMGKIPATAMASNVAHRNPLGNIRPHFAGGGKTFKDYKMPNLIEPTQDQVAQLVARFIPKDSNSSPIPQRKPPLPVASQGTVGIGDSEPDYSRGGFTPHHRHHMADGGLPPMSDMAPWYTRNEARGETYHPSGLLTGGVGGRTDTLNKIVPGGGYVMPADVVSGLGEGSTMAGANVIDKMMHSLPHGITGNRMGGRGMGIPRAPAQEKVQNLNMGMISRGGTPKGQGNVPVVLADGEYFIHPDQVTSLGKGNIKNGHKILDHLVMEIRKRTAKTLKGLPPPKGSRIKKDSK